MINLENRLWNAAVQTVRDAGMDFTVPCAHNLRDLIQAGTGVMRRSRRTSESDLVLADSHLSKLAREMVRVTQGQGVAALSGGKLRVRETALVAAKELCPLWPFG
jgi:hypothetical protein